MFDLMKKRLTTLHREWLIFNAVMKRFELDTPGTPCDCVKYAKLIYYEYSLKYVEGHSSIQYNCHRRDCGICSL